MTWTHPTYAEAVADAPATLRCACRRWVRPAEYYLLHDGSMASTGPVYCCAPCLEKLYLTGLVHPADVAAAVGAPEEQLLRLRQKSFLARVRDVPTNR